MFSTQKFQEQQDQNRFAAMYCTKTKTKKKLDCKRSEKRPEHTRDYETGRVLISQLVVTAFGQILSLFKNRKQRLGNCLVPVSCLKKRERKKAGFTKTLHNYRLLLTNSMCSILE